MKKIFIDVTQSCRSSNNSGIQVVTRRLYQELEQLCQTTTVLWDNHIQRYCLLTDKEKNILSNPFGKNYQAKARPNKQENPILKDILSSLFRLGRLVSLDKPPRNGQVLFFPEVFRDKRVTALKKSLHKELKKIAIFHDANVLKFPDITPPSKIKNFKSYLHFISTCDCITCVSEESKIEFQKHLLERNNNCKIKVEHWPVECPLNLPKPQTSEKIIVLCVSTLGYNKNHLTLLKAANQLWSKGMDFELELIGQADFAWTPKVLKEINRLNEQGRPIKWLQHVSQDTLEQKYANCSFTVYPSLFEGFGLPILESLIRGKPCICGNNGALGEVSNGGGCLRVSDQNDPKNLADAMGNLLSDSTTLDKLKKEASARDYGTWRSYATRMLEFVNSNK